MTEIEPLDSAELTLSYVSNKLSVGSKLTSTDKIMAMNASARQTHDKYGPQPRDSEPVDIPLPETVKGAVANART